MAASKNHLEAAKNIHAWAHPPQTNQVAIPQGGAQELGLHTYSSTTQLCRIRCNKTREVWTTEQERK